MANRGRRVLRPGGKRGVRTGGKQALYDALGNCDECCPTETCCPPGTIGIDTIDEQFVDANSLHPEWQGLSPVPSWAEITNGVRVVQPVNSERFYIPISGECNIDIEVRFQVQIYGGNFTDCTVALERPGILRPNISILQNATQTLINSQMLDNPIVVASGHLMQVRWLFETTNTAPPFPAVIDFTATEWIDGVQSPNQLTACGMTKCIDGTNLVNDSKIEFTVFSNASPAPYVPPALIIHEMQIDRDV